MTKTASQRTVHIDTVNALPACPVCFSPGVITAPRLDCLQCTCVKCAWNFTLWRRR